MANSQQGQQRKLVPIASPIKGINRVVSREQQSPDTCWNALNVLPFDKFGRRRVAQRFGTSKQYQSTLGSGNPIQGLLPISTIIYPATLNSGGLPIVNNSWDSLNGTNGWTTGDQGGNGQGGGNWTPNQTFPPGGGPAVLPPAPTLGQQPADLTHTLPLPKSGAFIGTFSTQVYLQSGMTGVAGSTLTAAFVWGYDKTFAPIAGGIFSSAMAVALDFLPQSQTMQLRYNFMGGAVVTQLAGHSAANGNNYTLAVALTAGGHASITVTETGATPGVHNFTPTGVNVSAAKRSTLDMVVFGSSPALASPVVLIQ